MRYFLGLLGVTAALILLAVSAAMNWRFGFTLGRTELDGHIYGAASAAADGLKALAPFFILWAFRQKNYVQSLAGVMILVVCSFYSLTSSLGFAAYNRAATTGEREVYANRYQDLKTELKRAEDKLGWIPQHRSVGEINADLTAILTKPVFSRKKGLLGTVDVLSESCSKHAWGTRKSCATVLELRKELAVAEQAKKLEVQVSSLKEKLASVSQNGGAATVTDADPQAQLFSKLLGLSKSDIQTGLTLLVSLLVEVGSGLGLFVAVSNIRTAKPYEHEQQPPYQYSREEPAIRVRRSPEQKPAKRLMLPKSDLERYYAERVEKSDGTSVTATDLFENYCDWCERNGRDAMALPVFGRQFSELGVQKAKIGGRIRYIGIQLKEIIDEPADDAEVATAV